MHHRNKRYAELAEKWLNGTITEEEKKEFSDWFDAPAKTPLNIPVEYAANEEALRRRILDNIRTRAGRTGKIRFLGKSPLSRIAAAVLLVVIAGGAGLVYLARHSSRPASPSLAVVKAYKEEVKPGGNKAVLTLGNGFRIVLDSAGSGMIAKESGTRVLKLENGRLAYRSPLEAGRGKEGAGGSGAAERSNAAEPVTYNTLSTPRGGQYSIVLADGTRVWLNSSSSLRYPTAFSGKERVVELTGEGYFEVAQNAAMPFQVKTRGMEVNVLGTHFNIMAYEEEAAIKTTLLEGSVRLGSVVLRPGQQAQLNSGGPIRVIKDADTEEAIAWKNGLFQFEQTDIRTIMRQIARWYDIDVVYEKNIDLHFSGTITKYSGVDQVFRMLEMTGAVHFTIQGRQVTVHS